MAEGSEAGGERDTEVAACCPAKLTSRPEREEPCPSNPPPPRRALLERWSHSKGAHFLSDGRTQKAEGIGTGKAGSRRQTGAHRVDASAFAAAAAALVEAGLEARHTAVRLQRRGRQITQQAKHGKDKDGLHTHHHSTLSFYLIKPQRDSSEFYSTTTHLFIHNDRGGGVLGALRVPRAATDTARRPVWLESPQVIPARNQAHHSTTTWTTDRSGTWPGRSTRSGCRLVVPLMLRDRCVAFWPEFRPRLTALSWVAVGVHRRRELPSPARAWKRPMWCGIEAFTAVFHHSGPLPRRPRGPRPHRA